MNRSFFAFVLLTIGFSACGLLDKKEDPPLGSEDTDGFVETDSNVELEETSSDFCGDGIINGYEECDGHQFLPDIRCEENGIVECIECFADYSGCSICGNYILEIDELCDGEIPAYLSCRTEISDKPEGSLSCTSHCELDLTDCHSLYCGDRIVEGDEACDDGNQIDGDGCSSHCEEEFCGDNIVQTSLNEACDGEISLTCADLGFASGELSCVECHLDTNECLPPTCGDGSINGSEHCDDGNTRAYDGCDPNCREEFCLFGNDSDLDGIDDCDDEEFCDGIDNNGNGAIDENPIDPEIGDSCYNGPEETENIGICRAGALACINGAIECSEAILPQTELCNGLDDDCNGFIPDDESDCSTEVILLGEQLGSAVFEILLPPTKVDLVFNLDTTASMGDVLAALTTSLEDVIIPSLQEASLDLAIGFTIFEDYPIAPFGDDSDLPFEIISRITTNPTRTFEALSTLSIGDGGDDPEAGIESLLQIATGPGTAWPKTNIQNEIHFPATLAMRDENDVDYYQFSVQDTAFLDIEVFARRGGSRLDPTISLLTADASTVIATSDDALGLDPKMTLTLQPNDYILRVSSCCGDDPQWGDTIGWYQLQVLKDGIPLIPQNGNCAELEDENNSTIPLVSVFEAWPYSIGSCIENCQITTEAPDENILAYCGNGVPFTICGDGQIGFAESCDDKNSNNHDGCNQFCQSELEHLLPADMRIGYSAAEGNGLRGGVGFRAGSLPFVVQITDSYSHTEESYTNEIQTHSTDEIFTALEEQNIRVIGVATNQTEPTLSDPNHYITLHELVDQTGAIVPVCAFQNSPSRIDGTCEEGLCCTGPNGSGILPIDGFCPLVFQVGNDGHGIDAAIVDGVTTLAQFAEQNIHLQIEPQTAEAACLIHSLEVTQVHENDCAPNFQTINEDGFHESIFHALANAPIQYELSFQNIDLQDYDNDNDSTEPCFTDANEFSFLLNGRTDDGVLIFQSSVSVQIDP